MKKLISFEPISEQQIQDYAEASGDHNRIHTDPNFAKEAGLPGVIAHGMLSMGLAHRALAEAELPVERIKKLESRFKDMVYVGDQLEAEFEVPHEILGSSLELKLRKKSGEQVLQLTAHF